MSPNLPLFTRFTNVCVIQRTNDPPRPPSQAHKVPHSPSQAFIGRSTNLHSHSTVQTMVQGSPFLECLELANRRRQQLQATTTANTDAQPQEEAQPTACASIADDDTKTPHRVHHVLPIATRALIVTWMKDEVSRNGEKHLAVKTVRHFTEFFRGSENANIKRAQRLWAAREEYQDEEGLVKTRGETSSVTRVTLQGPKRVRLKARKGRGRRRLPWVEALYSDVLDEFDRLRKLGVKFNLTTLRHLALDVLQTGKDDIYSANMIDPRSNVALRKKIDARWIQSFAEHFRIVSRAQSGKHRMSPAKENEIEIQVAAHLGALSSLLTRGVVDENDLENADETHFVINVDNGRTLGFCGSSDVKYADVVSGGEGFTMMVRLTGGRDARIANPFLVFTNKDCNYPIKGVPDDINGVAYRTGPKGWMDTRVMALWLSEKRVISTLPNGRTRHLYLDNCSGHLDTPQLQKAARDARTVIRYFPPNATHLIQPCDSFVIQKIKRAWTTHWETYKMGLIKANKWKDSCGKLHNPGKTYFIKLAARCIREVNSQRDAYGLTYARKAMIMTGMGLNTNGLWEVAQLTPELQAIVKKHSSVFDAARDASMAN